MRTWLRRFGRALGLACCALGVASAAAGMQPDGMRFEDLAPFDDMRRFGVAEAPPKAPGSFRLCTYNVENLFDGVDDPAYSGDDEDLDDEKPAHELLAVARAIRAVDADVLCVQEIESLEALIAFRDAYLSGMGYDHVASLDAGSSRGIEQAVLSRYPIEHVENWPGKRLGGVHPEKYGSRDNWYAGEPLAFRRSPLRVDVRVPDGADGELWTLLVVHHKSGRHSGYWREAEARGVLAVTEPVLALADRPVVVLGDFNAEVDAESVKIYMKNGFRDLLRTRAGGRAAWVTHESGRRIDLVLGNETAFKRVASKGFTLGTPARPDGIDWRDLDTFEGYAADHYPTCVDLSTLGSRAD